MKADKDFNKLVSPENQMDSERIKKFEEDFVKNGTLTSEEEQSMPLYIGAITVELMGRWVNIMCQVMHNPKEDTVFMQGRMRFEDTGNKKWFGTARKPYSEKEVDDIKKSIKERIEEFAMFGNIKVPYQDVTLPKGVEGDELIKILNDSNMFDIGVVPKK